MDEASSRFVDHLVTQKLVTEKLSKVRHRPTLPLDTRFGENESIVDDSHTNNGRVPLVEHSVSHARGTILLVHGLFEDNRDIYGFVIGELNRFGYSVHLTTLPFHYERRPHTSAFSGEFFFSADLHRTRLAFRQATFELCKTYLWLKQRHSLPTYVLGFSMGGAVALAAAARIADLDGLCLVNPATVLSEIVWTSPLCTTIKDDLISAGLSAAAVSSFMDTFDPTLLPDRSVSRPGLLLIYGLFDQVTQPHHYDRLVNHFNLPNVLRYKAGHLNILRVPRMADDIARFFDRRTHERCVMVPQGSK